MSDKNKDNVTPINQTEAEEATQPEAKTPSPEAIKEAREAVSRGKISLAVPLKATKGEATELNYDFGKLTNEDYLAAMDSDAGNSNMFRISHKQAFELFVRAAARLNNGLDETDLRRRMGVEDAMAAEQVAMYFFVFTKREAGARIGRP